MESLTTASAGSLLRTCAQALLDFEAQLVPVIDRNFLALRQDTAKHRRVRLHASVLTIDQFPADSDPHDRIWSLAGSTAFALRSSASASSRAWACSHGVRDACGDGHQIREEIEQRHAREIAEEVAVLQDKVDAERSIRYKLYPRLGFRRTLVG